MKTRLRILAAACAVFCSVFSLFTPAASAQVTWVPQYFPKADGYVSAIWFQSPQIGLIGFHWNITTSDAGMVKRTTDGGNTWTDCTIPATSSNTVPQVTDIWFLTPDTGWLTLGAGIGGSDSRLWRTVDSGKTWTSIWNKLTTPPLFGGGIFGLAAVWQTDSTLVVTQNESVGVWYSKDTGATWTSFPALHQNGLAFDHLLGVSSEFYTPTSTTTFLTTTDGGGTWVNAIFGYQHEGWNVHCIPNTGTFVAAPEGVPVGGVSQPSHIYRSINYGQRWTDVLPNGLPINTTGDVEGVQGNLFVQNSGGIVPSTAGLMESTDIGTTWFYIGGPNQGGNGPERQFDTRFAVTGCANTVWASDDSGGLWHTVNAYGLKFVDSNVMRPITATICQDTTQLYFLHNINTSAIIIQDIRILDTTRRPAKTHAVWLDSLPDSYISIQPHDSIAFKLAWQPHAMMDSTGSDSATIRVIYYASYLGPCSEMKLAYDTVLMHVKLNGLSVPANYAVNTIKIKTDTLTICQMVDTTINLVNTGCDTLMITQAMLAKNAWNLTDMSGNTLKLPIKLPSGDTLRFRLRATPTTAALLYDSLQVKMHYEGHDTLWGVPMRTWAKMGVGPLTAPATLAFDSLATCDSTEEFVTLNNTGCDTLYLNTATLADPHFRLLDTNGLPLKLPLAVPQGTFRLMVRFVPQDLGGKNGTIKLTYKYYGFDSSNVVAVSGTGASSGTLSYAPSINFGNVSICQPVTDTFYFTNTSCTSAQLTSLNISEPFVLLDSANFPISIGAGKRIGLRIQYAPTAKSVQSDSAHLRGWINNGQTGIDTTIALAGTGTSGTATFAANPGLTDSTFAFAPRTQCDHTDSVSFYVHNSGCDTLMLTGLTLDPSLSTVFDAHAATSLPAAIPGYDSVKVTVGIVDLLAGNYNGNLHIQLKFPDGSTKDSVAAVRDSITQGSGGATTLSLKSPTTQDFGAIPPCSTITDTTILVTYEAGCGTVVLHDSLAGTGFILVGTDSVLLSPGDTARIQVAYDGSTRGNLNGTLYFKAPPGIIIANVTFMGTVRPVDSVHFHVQLSSSSTVAGQQLTASLLPDIAVSGVGLHSIHGEFIWRADNFVVNQGTMSAQAGLTLGQQGPNTVGTLGTYSFDVTNSNDIPLDPSQPVVSLPMVMMVSDTPAGLIAVDSIRLNESDPTFSECTLATTSLAGNSSLAITCSDSTLIYHLEGRSLLLSEQPRPNPVTSETGYQTTVDLTAALDGQAEIMLFDNMGREVAHDAIPLTHDKMQSYSFDMHNLPAGNYHYELLFSGTSGTASANGSLLLVK